MPVVLEAAACRNHLRSLKMTGSLTSDVLVHLAWGTAWKSGFLNLSGDSYVELRLIHGQTSSAQMASPHPQTPRTLLCVRLFVPPHS